VLLSSGAVAQPKAESSALQSVYHFQSLEDSAIGKSHNGFLGVLDGWSIYKDIIFPGTSIYGKLLHNRSFLPGSKLLNCRIAGGDAYNNLFFTCTLAKKWKGEPWVFTDANAFTYSMDFYVDSYIDCDTSNLSQLEGLEFTFQQAMPPSSFLWGLQWSKSNVWSYWDDTKLNDKARGWVKIPELHACMLYKQWNHIRISGHRTDKGLYYDTLFLNNSSFVINSFVPVAFVPPHWAENYLQVGFQINGDKAIRKDHPHGTDPVSVLLNNVELTARKQLHEPVSKQAKDKAL
jgi:hypothetical protein